jgi:cysteinyl-tRNA synthetase
MSYTAGNAVTIAELREQGRSPREVRLVLLQTHYRQPLRFSAASLDAARASLTRIDEFRSKLRGELPAGRHDEVDALINELRAGFREAICDDLNVSSALAALFAFVRKGNALLAERRVGAENVAAIEAALDEVDAVLGVLEPEAAAEAELPPQVTELLENREAARRARDFAEADRLRAAMSELGFQVDDTPAGPRLRHR